MLADHGDVLRAVLRFVRDRLVDRWMRTSPLFRPFTDAQRSELASRFRFLEIEAQTKLLAAYDCYEKEVCMILPDKVWSINDLGVLVDRHKKCAPERSAAAACTKK